MGAVGTAQRRFTPEQAQALFERAAAAGKAAGEAARPTPMNLIERANPIDDTSPITKVWAPVMEGPCGMAYVNIRPANSSFASWLKKRAAKYGLASSGLGNPYKGYHGGMEIAVHAFGQSLERKWAYANAFAKVLQDEGVKCYTSTWEN